MKQLITILLLFTSFMVAKPKFTDKQIAATKSLGTQIGWA